MRFGQLDFSNQHSPCTERLCENKKEFFRRCRVQMRRKKEQFVKKVKAKGNFFVWEKFSSMFWRRRFDICISLICLKLKWAVSWTWSCGDWIWTCVSAKQYFSSRLGLLDVCVCVNPPASKNNAGTVGNVTHRYNDCKSLTWINTTQTNTHTYTPYKNTLSQ